MHIDTNMYACMHTNRYKHRYMHVEIQISMCCFIYFFFSVSKTNLVVHEDRNRVPYVKVRMFLFICEFFIF